MKKEINRVAKGKRIVDKAELLLKKQNYQVEKAPHTWYKKDYFGIFDIIAVNNKQIRLIQITSEVIRDLSKLKKIQGFEVPTRCVTKEIWVWKHKKKKFEIRFY